MDDPGDKKPFAALMRGLAAAGRFKEEITVELLQLYWYALVDLSLEEFRGAVKRAIVTLDEFPSVHDLRKLAGRPALLPGLPDATKVLAELHRCTFHTEHPEGVRAESTAWWCDPCLQQRPRELGPITPGEGWT